MKNNKKLKKNKKTILTIANEKKCDKCEKKYEIILAYGPHKFCEKHFVEFLRTGYEKLLENTI